MASVEHDPPSYCPTSPLVKSQERENIKNSHLVNPCCNSDTYAQYVVPPLPQSPATPATPSTQMIISTTYSPVPGVQDSNAIYSSPPYHHHHHHHPTIIHSPPFIHNTIGPPSSPSIYSNHHPHHHHHHHQQQQHPVSSSSQPTSRTVYLGHMTTDTDVSDVLDQVRSGMIETTRLILEKNCLFLTFVDPSAAIQFYYQVANRPLIIKGVEIKVGWGKPSVLSSHIRLALQNGASRNVFLGSLDETVTEENIRHDLKRFGTIEHVRLIREKNIAFVHFLSIANAIKCVDDLSEDEDWKSCRVSFGKDRCCPSSSSNSPPNTTMYSDPTLSPPPPPPPPSYHGHPHLPPYQLIHLPQHTYQVHYSSYDPYTGTTTETYTAPPPPPPTVTPSSLPSPVATTHTIMHQHQPNINDPTTPNFIHNNNYYQYPYLNIATGNKLSDMSNRTIYFGNIHPDTTYEEICNVIRGGILYQIRFIKEKHIAFVTFVDPDRALQFYTEACNNQGIIIKGRRLRLGWGKPSNLPEYILQAVQQGASRNVYLGNIDDDQMTLEKLDNDFAEYGTIELINTLKEKNCAFVNFTSIAAAIRAMEGIRKKEEYKEVRINYGKDRCGNPPRQQQQQQQQQQRHHHHHPSSKQQGRLVTTDPSLLSLSLSSSSSSSASSSSLNGIITPTTVTTVTTQEPTDPLTVHPSRQENDTNK